MPSRRIERGDEALTMRRHAGRAAPDKLAFDFIFTSFGQAFA
jgi:hypothetical protein